MKSLYLILTY